MSLKQYETTPQDDRSILLSADVSKVIQGTVLDYGVDIYALIDESLKLGLKFIRSSQQGTKWYVQEPDGQLARLATSPLDFSPITSPAGDAATLASKPVYQDKISSDQNLQTTAVSLVTTAAQRIQERFGHRLESKHHLLLEHIQEGVLVINNQAEIVKSNGMIITTTIEGEVVKPYNAVLLNGNQLQKEQLPQEENYHTAAHEVWHVLGENNLPELLNEALTDVLAERTIDYPARQTRLGKSFRLAFKLLRQVEKITGADEVLQAYLNSPYIKVTVDLETRTTTETFVDLPLHQHMRQILGRDKQGNDHWNQILDLIAARKLPEAYGLFSKRLFIHRLKESLQTASESLNRLLKPTLFLGR